MIYKVYGQYSSELSFLIVHTLSMHAGSPHPQSKGPAHTAVQAMPRQKGVCSLFTVLVGWQQASGTQSVSTSQERFTFSGEGLGVKKTA